jgi:hypothetical protein
MWTVTCEVPGSIPGLTHSSCDREGNTITCRFSMRARACLTILKTVVDSKVPVFLCNCQQGDLPVVVWSVYNALQCHFHNEMVLIPCVHLGLHETMLTVDLDRQTVIEFTSPILLTVQIMSLALMSIARELPTLHVGPIDSRTRL